MRCVATFHTHLSAMRTQRSLRAAGARAVLAPVPRRLSASCGTCVRYEAEDACLACMDADVDCVYVQHEADDGFDLLYENRA